MGTITSAIEIIGDYKYIVERDELGTIICQSLYDEPVIVAPPPDIKLSEVTTINGGSYMEFVVTKLGTYRLNIGEATKQVIASL